MIETNYEYDSGYHEGTLVEQDALAFLGVFKCIEDVPDRYHLANFAADMDAETAWDAFDAAELEGKSYQTRRYKYGKAWREWRSYCEACDIHPALPDPQDIEIHLTEQREEMDELGTVYTNRFRPLYLWFRWMLFHPTYPHRYNPTLMAVLLGGTVYDVWRLRLHDRQNVPDSQ